VILFKFQAWPRGSNILSAGVYNLAGWQTLIFWPLNRKSVAVRLPMRATTAAR